MYLLGIIGKASDSAALLVDQDMVMLALGKTAKESLERGCQSRIALHASRTVLAYAILEYPIRSCS